MFEKKPTFLSRIATQSKILSSPIVLYPLSFQTKKGEATS